VLTAAFISDIQQQTIHKATAAAAAAVVMVTV